MRDKFLTAMFCLFVFGFSALFFTLPKQTFSPNEKRELEGAPRFSVSSVLSGGFERGYEDYLADHFPFRDKLVAMNSYYLLYTGRNGVNGVYKGKDGYLMNTPVKADYEILNANLQAMLDFTEKTGITSKLMLIPSAGYVMSDKLPMTARDYHDGELLECAKEMTEAYIGWIDVGGLFEEIKEDSTLYYRTDHHWTSEGAYNAYTQYCTNVGFEPLWDFEKEGYDGFYGTAYSKSALWGEKSESLEVWNYPHDVSVSIDDRAEYADMFFYSHLNEADKYPVFLDGNHGIERIVNHENADAGRLLVIKDSYAHSIVPFLISHYSSIDMVDLRYYFTPVSELTAENEYDGILYMYGLGNLCESSDAAILE